MPTTILPPDPGSVGGPYDVSTADLVRPYIASAGGEGYGLVSITQTVRLLSRSWDENESRYGDRVYEYVAADPPGGSSVDLLVRAALVNEVQIVPAHAPPPRGVEDAEQQARADEAARWVDLCRYALDRLAIPFHETLTEFVEDALTYGCKLGELVWGFPATGEHRRQIIPISLDPKPRSVWRFAVDPYMRQVGIYAWQAGTAPVVLPREKFAILTFGRKNGDPRGRSVYHRAAKWWNVRAQLVPEHFRFCQRFGAPFLWGTLPPEDQIGHIDPAGKTPEEQMLAAMQELRNGAVAVFKNGAAVHLEEPKGDGQAFTAGMDFYGRQMVLAILLQVRATLESQFGSRADSQTSQDVLGNLVLWLRVWVAKFLMREVLYKILLYNGGSEVADQYTPWVNFGEVEHQDRSRLGDMIARLMTASYLAPSQLPELDAMLGFPVRMPEEVGIPQPVAGQAPAPVPTPAEDSVDEPMDDGETMDMIMMDGDKMDGEGN